MAVQVTYEFGPYQLDGVERTLWRQGKTVALTPKVFDLLFALVRNAGRVIQKEELMHEVWPDTSVEENNLTVNISALRKVFGEDSSGQAYIETLPRRGYRFAARVWGPAGFESRHPQRTEAEEHDSKILVGRERELDKLEGFLRRAIEGAGHMVFITGEPGIGKTALSRAFLQRARGGLHGVRVCRGRCVEQYGEGEPYLPVLDLLSELLSGSAGRFVADTLLDHAPTWCLQFPAVFGSNQGLDRLYRETIGATKERMLREIVDALAALASATPLVLHFEDFHWADPSSIDLLRRLCQDLAGQRLLIVGTYRPGDVERGNPPFKNVLLEMQAHDQCQEIALAPLRCEDLVHYLDARFYPNEFASKLANLVHRKTEGQPLFATGMVQLLVERGEVAKTGERWVVTRLIPELDLEAPVSVRKMIQKKIEALDPEERHALEYASIQGDEFTSAVLAALLETDELDLEERLVHLDKVHRLIQTIGEEELADGTLTTRYRFQHVLYQNTLYADFVNKRRVLLHRRTADLIIRFYGGHAPRFATQLALHFERARDYARTVEFLLQAGDNSIQILAHENAAEHYSRALAFVPQIPLEQQAAKLLAIYRKRGAAYFALSQFDRAIADFNSMLREARENHDRAGEHSTLNALAEVFFWAHRLEDADECARQALHIADALGNERLRVETLVLIAMRQDIVGELAEARRSFGEIIRSARALGARQALLGALTFRGQLHFFQSEYECAREVLREALELASELRHGPSLLQGQFFLGLSLGNLGRISEALEVLRDATRTARRNGDQYWQAKIPNCIGWLYRELQNFDEALKYDLEGLEIAHASKVTEAESNSLISLGYDRDSLAASSEALQSFDQARTILEADVFCRWRFRLRLYAGLAAHHRSRGELGKAEEYARLLLAHATRYEARKYIAIAHQLLAEIAAGRSHFSDAEAHLTCALAQLGSFPVLLVSWKVYSALGRLRLQSGNGSAMEAFENAATIVHAIAAQVREQEVRAAFLAAPAVQEVLAGHARVSA